LTLKQAIVEELNKLPQRFIDCIIGEWRRHLTNVVQQQGIDTLSTFKLSE